MKEKLFISTSFIVFVALLLFQFVAVAQSQNEIRFNQDRSGAVVPLTTTTPTVTPTPTGTVVTPTMTLTMTPTSEPVVYHIFSPIIFVDRKEIPELPDSLPAPLIFTQTSPVDFEQAAADLEKDGLELGYNKIGFHTGFGGNRTGLLEQFQKLDGAGVPIFIKAVDVPEPVYQVQQLAEASGLPHVMVFRRHGGGFELPNYDNDPIEEARIHYERHVSAWPKELDPTKVWMETINEPDKNRSEWLAIYSLEIAKLAVADNRKVAAFSWSAGEPEIEHWEGEAMLEYLRYAAAHKDNVAVALHEYSFEGDNVTRLYPWLMGRFQFLFRVVDKHGIDRPTVLITEWGWAATDLPGEEAAMEDIMWANRMYNAYPEVLGAGIWYLGGNFKGIAQKAARLIDPVGEMGVTTYFGITPGKGEIDDTLFYDPTMPTR